MKARLFTINLKSFLLLSLASARVWGAACCAGGSSVPGLITGDDQFLFSTAVAWEESRELARAGGERGRKSAADGAQTLTLRATGVFLENWQAGFEFPVVRRYQEVRDSVTAATGLGDLSFVTGYELISDMAYSPYRPKVILFSRLMIPTGKSVYEITDFGNDLPIGKGFPEWGAGVLAIKSWGRWDVALNAQANWILGRSFKMSGGVNEFDSTYSWGGGGAVGYFFGFLPLRLAASVNYLEQSHRNLHFQGATSLVSARAVWDTAITLGARWSDEWSTNLIYNDQTIFPGRAADLSRSVSLSIQRNFPL